MKDDIIIHNIQKEINAIKLRLSRLEAMTPDFSAEENAPEPEPPPYIEAAPISKAEEVASVPSESPDYSALLGGSILNKIGAVSLILGMGFFLKYAIDQNWINESGRIALGIIVGLACLFAGDYFEGKKLPLFAHGLLGAGISILYFTIYASYSFYYLVNTTVAFMAMIIITAVAIAVSVRYDSKSITVLGIIGGYLTPALLGSPRGGENIYSYTNDVIVLSYITILSVGILGVTYYKNWKGLNLLSLIGAFLIFGSMYSELPIDISFTFLTLLFLIFAAQAYTHNVIKKRDLSFVDHILAGLPPILFYLYSYDILSLGISKWAGIFTLMLSGIYIAASYQVFRAGFQDKVLGKFYLGIAATFLTIAIPIQLKGIWVSLGWGVEALAFAYIGLRMNSPSTRIISNGLFIISVIDLLSWSFNHLPGFQYYSYSSYRKIEMLFANQRFLVFLMIAVISLLIVHLYRRDSEQHIAPREKWVKDAYIIAANSLLLLALSFEIWSHMEWMSRDMSRIALSAIWLVYGVITLTAGIQYKYKPILIFGLVSLGYVIAKSYFIDVWYLEMTGRIIAFIGLGVVVLIASYIYQKYGSSGLGPRSLGG